MNYSIPAYLSNFSTLDNGRTKAKLRVFSVGETGDGRIFDKNFSDQLKSSLPDTPVVAYYSDLKKDFLGHNATQYAFGHVPSDNEGEYVDDPEDGKTWIETDVILYTDRGDDIGEIAKKIVGHPHSLELDPKTVKYEIIHEAGKSKIHFLEGRICGLSVLGMEQKPAFKGSAFLNCEDTSKLRERFENFFQVLEDESRGGQMNEKLNVFEDLVNNAKLSYSDQQHKVADKFGAEMGDHVWSYIAEMYDDHAIFATYDLDTDKEGFYQCSYKIGEDGEVALSDLTEVFHVFVTAAQLNSLSAAPAPVNAAAQDEDPEKKKEEESQCAADPEKKDEKKDPEVPAEEDKDPEADPKDDKAPEDEDPEKKKDNASLNASEGESNADNTSVPTDYAALYQSSQEELEASKAKQTEFEAKNNELTAELESVKATLETVNGELGAFKLKEKQTLIASYKEDLSEDVIADFNANINDVDYGTLEGQLALAYTKSHKGKTVKTEVPLDFNLEQAPAAQEANVNDFASLVNKWKKR